MVRVRVWAAAAVLAGFAAFAPESPSQPGKRPTPAGMPAATGVAAPAGPPRLQPVAETKLIMAGLAKPNFDGLAKAFKDRPADAEAWQFARGQALLVAESGNLLMMRPPKAKAAQDAWMARAAETREAATKVARAAADADYLTARTALAGLANSCNRCHEGFQVKTRVNPADAD